VPGTAKPFTQFPAIGEKCFTGRLAKSDHHPRLFHAFPPGMNQPL
jgi:hypothetical protein